MRPGHRAQWGTRDKLEFRDELGAYPPDGEPYQVSEGFLLATMFGETKIFYRVFNDWPTRDAAVPEEGC